MYFIMRSSIMIPKLVLLRDIVLNCGLLRNTGVLLYFSIAIETRVQLKNLYSAFESAD